MRVAPGGSRKSHNAPLAAILSRDGASLVALVTRDTPRWELGTGRSGYGRTVRRIALIVALVLLGGCAPASNDSTAPGQGEETGIVLPPRPRDIHIDGIEPCTLLTEHQREKLGLEDLTYSSTKPSRLFRGDLPMCSLIGSSPRAVSVSLSIATTAGIELFSRGELEADLRGSTVTGFPAIIAVPRQFSNFCDVLIDVAPGQLLDVQYSDGGRLPPVPQDQLCSGGEDTAAAAMETLLSR